MDTLLRAATIAFAEIAAGGRIAVAARRMSAAAWCAAVAAVFATASAGCGIAALWIFVLPDVGPVGAALIAAAALLLLCLSLLAIVATILRRRRQAPLPATVVPVATLPVVLIAEAARLFGENKGAALLAALLAGATAGTRDRK
jgi:hypothetical protein